jgi:alanine racemase
MRYTIQAIAERVGGRLILLSDPSLPVEQLVTDSRRITQGSTSLFFALSSSHNDGHRYLADAYRKGVRQFVISDPNQLPEAFTDVNVLLVPGVLGALQALAAAHRTRFSIPVVGITGSNGKTVVKEWLNQLLSPDLAIVRSPKSYNSQLGVPLSVWQLAPSHQLAIFEAGISRNGEMERLEAVIRPTIGILTHLGEAHDEGFSSRAEKLREKCRLFAGVSLLIGEWELLQEASLNLPLFSWGRGPEATVQIREIKREGEQTVIEAIYRGNTERLRIPFTDKASIQNSLHCWCLLLHLGLQQSTIQQRFLQLHAVDMRLQLKAASNGCLLVNDSYSADLDSLRIALHFLHQQSAGLKRTVILSDFDESGREGVELYREVASLLNQFNISRVILVGAAITQGMEGLLQATEVSYYAATDSLLAALRLSTFYREIILVKGARRFAFERVADSFVLKQHETVLEINLNAVAHNLRQYQLRLQPGTRVMAMVKAFSYGSGGAEIASVLQDHGVHYLGVAYADEGVELARAGLQLPVMVLNAEPGTFRTLVDHGLQPVLYSFALLEQFESFLSAEGLTAYPVHVELETGMNRLGFGEEEVGQLAARLQASVSFRVQSVFSHLAGSEDASLDDFTIEQQQRFQRMSALLQQKLPYPFLRHLANSAAAVRHPGLQFDMVRLGIGLYGVEVHTSIKLDLQPVATLRSTVAQLKDLPAGATVSYNRRGVLARPSRIATVRIGYADGYSRRFGNGVGEMWVRGKAAPVVGTVCMDMTMIDVTHIPGVMEGDEVTVFGGPMPVEEAASRIGTIPYELMTGISQRVKRVYFHE